MVGRGEGRLGEESAAVEVDQDGELPSGGVPREVEPGGEVEVRREHDVLGADAGGRIGRRRSDVLADESLDSAVFVDSDEREDVVENGVCGGECLRE